MKEFLCILCIALVLAFVFTIGFVITYAILNWICGRFK